jgi:hypothetical protein
MLNLKDIEALNKQTREPTASMGFYACEMQKKYKN